jgi:hypothetical protein
MPPQARRWAFGSTPPSIAKRLAQPRTSLRLSSRQQAQARGSSLVTHDKYFTPRRRGRQSGSDHHRVLRGARARAQRPVLLELGQRDSSRRHEGCQCLGLFGLIGNAGEWLNDPPRGRALPGPLTDPGAAPYKSPQFRVWRKCFIIGRPTRAPGAGRRYPRGSALLAPSNRSKKSRLASRDADDRRIRLAPALTICRGPRGFLRPLA